LHLGQAPGTGADHLGVFSSRRRWKVSFHTVVVVFDLANALTSSDEEACHEIDTSDWPAPADYIPEQPVTDAFLKDVR